MINKLIKDKTTLGKGGKVLLYVGLSAALVAVFQSMVDTPDQFAPWLVALANVLLVVFKNYNDPKIRNY